MENSTVSQKSDERESAIRTDEELALKMKPLVQKKAKANLVVSTGGTVPRPLQKSEKVVPIHMEETRNRVQ